MVAASPNSPATGAPAVTGTARMGETLTVDTSGIADEDGLNNVPFAYQWLSDDAEISGDTSSTHTLLAADEGRTIKAINEHGEVSERSRWVLADTPAG